MQALAAQLAASQRGVKRYAPPVSAHDIMNSRPETGRSVRQKLDGNKYNFAGYVKNNPLPELTPMHDIERVNPRIILFGRQYYALDSIAHYKSADLGPPSTNQVALVMRTRPNGKNPVLMGLGQKRDMTAVIQSAPAIAATILQWNFMMAEIQAKWRKQDREAYQQITPRMLWFGFPEEYKSEPEYTKMLIVQKLLGLADMDTYLGWSTDGLVRHVSGFNGNAPDKNDGFMLAADGNMYSGGITKGYMATVVAAGDTEMLDYCEGRGVVEGARIGLILRKYPHANYLRHASDAAELRFNMSHKLHDSVRDTAAMLRYVDTETSLIKGKSDPILPLLLSVVSIPDGGPCPSQWTDYTDEDGFEHTDGLFLSLGSVWAAPMRMSYKLPYEDGNELKPFMDGRASIESDPIHMLVDPDDGFCHN